MGSAVESGYFCQKRLIFDQRGTATLCSRIHCKNFHNDQGEQFRFTGKMPSPVLKNGVDQYPGRTASKGRLDIRQ
jgi:hypothetical protein